MKATSTSEEPEKYEKQTAAQESDKKGLKKRALLLEALLDEVPLSVFAK